MKAVRPRSVTRKTHGSSLVRGERPDDGAAVRKLENVERPELVEREHRLRELPLERLGVAEPEFALHAPARRCGAVDREDRVEGGNGREAARMVEQVRGLEMVLVGVRHQDVPHAAQDVAVRLPRLKGVGAEVDLHVAAEVVARAGADVGAALRGGLPADAAVAEKRGNPLGGGGAEDQKRRLVHARPPSGGRRGGGSGTAARGAVRPSGT